MLTVSAIVVHEPCQDRKVAALSEFAMCADFFICLKLGQLIFCLQKRYGCFYTKLILYLFFFGKTVFNSFKIPFSNSSLINSFVE